MFSCEVPRKVLIGNMIWIPFDAAWKASRFCVFGFLQMMDDVSATSSRKSDFGFVNNWIRMVARKQCFSYISTNGFKSELCCLFEFQDIEEKVKMAGRESLQK